MLKEITLGQYFPGDSLIHRLDPRTKLMVVVLFIIALIATLVIGFLLAKVIPVAKLYEWMNARIGVK